MEDIKDIEPELYQSFKKLLEYEDDVKDLCLTFEVEYELYGEHIT